MPVFNLTIDDTCPLIQYALWWSDSSSADSFISDYVNSTFHATDIQGATASLTFNGSAVYIYGAKRPNHDVYAVTLDQTTVTANGNSGDASVNLFNQLLFSKTDLDNAQHTVTLKNQYTTADASWVDVDYMLVTTGDGNEKTESNDTVWDDGNTGIVYSASWDSTPNSLADQYYMGTMHVTSAANASASIIFSGNAIAVYGATSGNHGLYSVSLDGQTPMIFNGTASAFRPQNLLYWAGNIPDGKHNVTVMNLDQNGLFLDLDKVVISEWPGFDGEASGTGTATSASSSHTASGSGDSNENSSTSSNKTAVGPIVGGVVAGVAVLAIILGALLFFLRRRRRRGLDRIVPSSEGMKGDPEPFTIEPFNGGRETHDVNERSPLSPANVERDHMRTPFSASFDTSNNQGYSRSDFGAGSDTSKYIFPMSITQQQQENPHRDLPPPDYEQATAGASSRPLPLPIEVPRPSVDITVTGQSTSDFAEGSSSDTPARPRKS